MKKTIKINYGLLIVGLVAVLGIFVGSYLDLDITKAIGNNRSSIPILLTAVGNMPTIYSGVFAGTVLASHPCKTKIGNIFAKLIGIGSIVSMTGFQIYSSAAYADFEVMQPQRTLWIILIIAISLIIVSLIIFFTLKNRNKFNQQNLFTVSILILSIVISYAGFTEVVKYLACRPRPNVVLSGVEEFRNWYEWSPFYCFKHEDCRSFVSGHSANSACMISILPLLVSLTKFREKKGSYTIAFFIGLLFNLIVAFSRIIAEQHFLSDIMGGILLSIIFQSLSLRIAPYFLKKYGPRE